MNGTARAAAVAVAALSAVAFGILQSDGPALEEADTVTLGRQVYIAEGCIHCHSQYVRPVGPDEELWGPVTAVETALAQEPVLIGNRRQGPDLANVGLRRDATWNRLHLIDPPSMTPGSRMPSYRHLFSGEDPRGEALLSYLSQLKGSPEDEF
jgi:cytochrome c oxidase cbb3-type subunit 2